MPKSKQSKSKPKLHPALALLVEDHRKVQKLFKQFEKLDGTESSAQQIVKQACLELTVHARLEEEAFYPALREQLDEQELVDEAEVEHGVAKQLIQQLENMGPDDPHYGATFKVLGEYVNHHIEEEENEIFKRAKRKDVDLDAIAEEMERRKPQIMSELGLAEPSESRQAGEKRGKPSARPRLHA